MQVNTTCTILTKDAPNPHAVRFTLDVGNMVRDSFTSPGQFVHIKCGEERLLRRPISVCACQEGQDHDTLTIVFEVRGAGTDWLAQREPGDKLDVLGLLGHGFRMDPKGRYLLVGGGIGVPPMLGCAQYAPRRCDVVVAARDKDHLLLLPEFQETCATVAVATEDGSLGAKGFATGPMEQLLKENRYDAVLACGPKPMLKAVWELARKYDTPCQVSMEERMACGVGACLGCATPMTDGTMKHVCKDGPVFDASEVDWNG